jgi:hypothetical protein
MKNALELIAEERKHQMEKLGFTLEYDLENRSDGSLLQLAYYMIFSNDKNMPEKKGWSQDYIRKFLLLPRIKQLTIAAALIAAEIDLRQSPDYKGIS